MLYGVDTIGLVLVVLLVWYLTGEPMPQKWIDFGERVLATAAEAALAYAITRVADLTPAYAVVITPVLAGIKSKIAMWVGNKDSASLTKSV